MRVGLHLVASALGIWSSPRSNSAHDRLLSAVLCHGDYCGTHASPVFWCHGDAASLVPVDSCKRTGGRRSITMCGLEISDPQTLEIPHLSCSPPVSSSRLDEPVDINMGIFAYILLTYRAYCVSTAPCVCPPVPLQWHSPSCLNQKGQADPVMNAPGSPSCPPRFRRGYLDARASS